MKTCSIEGCNKRHEAKGYCKNHYKSLLKYSDPLRVERNKQERKIKSSQKPERKWICQSTHGTCEVEDCRNPIKARRLCDKHLQRLYRNGDIGKDRPELYGCIVPACSKPHKTGGYCTKHYAYYRRHGTPFKAKTVKLCALDKCNEPHFGRGLCEGHLKDFKKLLKKIGKEDF